MSSFNRNPPPHFAAKFMSPLILDAVTSEVGQADRLAEERMGGAKRMLDAGFLGSPPLFRRACRGALKGRYDQAALVVPAIALGAASFAACYVAIPTLGLVNDWRGKPHSVESAWERRFCRAVSGHLSSIWGREVTSIKMEHIFMDWVKRELALKPDRLRYSEKIWWSMRKWSRELSMREKMLGYD